MSAKSHALSQVENQVELASSGSLSDRAVALLDSRQLLSRDDKKAYDKLQAVIHPLYVRAISLKKFGFAIWLHINGTSCGCAVSSTA
jgi:hypothetical protein